MKPLLLDTFCGAGGAGMGYHLAGFEVVGVDIAPQPHYPFKFIQGDALEYIAAHGHEFDAIHASPECQGYSVMFNPLKPEKRDNHARLIPQVRQLLINTGKPFVIENVKGARKELISPLRLHGSLFGLPIYFDRYFELNGFQIWFTPSIRKDYVPVPVSSSSKRGNTYAPAEKMREAKGIEWYVTKMESRQMIPPAYTHFIGEQLMKVIDCL